MSFEETEWAVEIEVDVDDEANEAATVLAEALPPPPLRPEPSRKATKEMPATLVTYLNDQVRASIVRERNEARRAPLPVIILPAKR